LSFLNCRGSAGRIIPIAGFFPGVFKIERRGSLLGALIPITAGRAAIPTCRGLPFSRGFRLPANRRNVSALRRLPFLSPGGRGTIRRITPAAIPVIFPGSA